MSVPIISKEHDITNLQMLSILSMLSGTNTLY